MAALRFSRNTYAALASRLLGNLALLALLAGNLATAQLVRVANSSLTLPQNPQTFGFQTETAFSGITFNQPVGLATAPGETDRVFVIEKPGRVQVVTNLGSTPAKQQFLDLTSKVLVSDATEEGLLGLAFHPDFATNHYFYVFYTTSTTTAAGTGRHDRLSRFTALPSPATNDDILATEVPLISQWDEASNHNGGDLHFGPDGYLYVALGDEGGGNDQYSNSQRIDKDFFSGLLRIDVDRRAGNPAPNPHASVHPGTYAVPADNPFVGATSFNGIAVTPANVRTEFWAVGLRNPWRFSFDTPTGRLLVGDVGQDAREEIDLIVRGGNYGWNYREGTIAGPRANPPAAATFIDPIWDTDRNTASSITGGVVYRGSRFAQLFGRYVFGDYPSGRIFAMTFPASGPVSVQQIATDASPVGFGLDPSNGDVLFACVATGAVKRLVYNSTPTGTPLPATLSATGAFSNVAALTPASGVVGYTPNVSFWSDYAVKRRWFSVPALADKITFAADGNWTFPAGTVWVKHFDLELTRGDPSTARRLETRFLVKTASGIYGVTYRWNPEQTEATLVPEEGASETITINDAGTLRSQTWRYPSRADCLQCHTTVADHALSFNTAQLNRSAVYGAVTANQLSALADAGYFTSTIPSPSTLRTLATATDSSATIEYRARSYLAANCAQCHQPGGPAQGNWDARIATPTDNAGLIDGPLVNSAGDSANRVIKLGDTGHSMLLTKISRRGTGQMPPLASNELDQADINLITSWINGGGQSPVISTQPVSQTAAAGNAVTFVVVASGSPTYQWKKNGTAIPGATGSSYTIGSVARADAGSYTVVATNNIGSATSNSAVLVVVDTASATDFNADGKSDLVWQNSATGERRIWLMNGTTFGSEVSLGVLPDEWAIATTGDFNGDGKSDLAWTNTQTGERRIWLMNGTSAGSITSLGIVPLEWSIAGAGDFNADGKSDLVWTNTITGERRVWFMDGGALTGDLYLTTLPVDWVIACTGDFNHDGKADLVWQITTTGERRIWVMNGSSLLMEVLLGMVPVEWTIVGSGDFNADGKGDLVWTNTITGERSLWLMNGTVYGSTVSLGTVGLEWRLGRPEAPTRRIAADFNGDAKSDLVWSNTSTGERYLWLMNGPAFGSSIFLGSIPPEWSIAATGDFNADARSDLVWQNSLTGERVIWLMNGASVLAGASLGVIPAEWIISASGDFNADGKSDLVWTNTTTGERIVWLMNGSSVSSSVSLGVVPIQWMISGAGDFNSDGKSDLIWSNTVTGERYVWLMNGTVLQSSVFLGTVPPDWLIAASGDFNSDGKSDLVWSNAATGERAIWLMNGTDFASSVSLGVIAVEWRLRN